MLSPGSWWIEISCVICFCSHLGDKGRGTEPRWWMGYIEQHWISKSPHLNKFDKIMRGFTRHQDLVIDAKLTYAKHITYHRVVLAGVAIILLFCFILLFVLNFTILTLEVICPFKLVKWKYMLVFLNETGIRRIGSSTSFKYSDIVYTISGSQRYRGTCNFDCVICHMV